MRLLALLLALLLAAAPLGGQPATPVVLAWDLEPSHDGATWEVETAAGLVPCTAVQVLATERRCTAAIVRTAPQAIRLRGVNAAGVGAWSAPLTLPATGAGPGPFTITIAVPGLAGDPMAVTHLATYQNGGQASATPSIASVVGGGAGEANRLLWQAVLWRDTGQTCDAMDYGGSALTLSTGQTAGGIGIRVGYLVAPSGTQTAAATMSAAPGIVWIITKVFAGVDQTTPYASGPLYASGIGVQSATVTITLPSTGMLADALYIRDQIAAQLAANADQVDDYSEQESGFGSTVGSSHDGTSDNIGWSWTNFVNVHQVAVALAPAATASGPPPPFARRTRVLTRQRHARLLPRPGLPGFHRDPVTGLLLPALIAGPRRKAA